MADIEKRMISPGFYVPAIPRNDREEVFGQRKGDFARVELAVLRIEQWLDPRLPQRLAHDRVLEILRGSIQNESNAWDLIRLLARRGNVAQFFALTQPIYDKKAELRAFLLRQNIDNDAIRFYSNWSGVDPRLFLQGFVIGVAESLASSVFGLADLAKLALRIQEAELRVVYELTADLSTGIDHLLGQIAIVERVFAALVSELDPRELPAKVVGAWDRWNGEFRRHLEDLDAFAAGRTLGKIGGDLWQLLTGFVAVARLLGIGFLAAKRYAPLVAGRITRTAAEFSVVLARLAAVLQALGRGVIDSLPRVGLGLVRTMFPPAARRRLAQGAAFVLGDGFTAIPMLRPAYATAFGESRLSTPFAVIVSDANGPLAMAAVSDALPSAREIEEGERAVEDFLAKLERNVDVDKASLKQSTPSRVELARAALLDGNLEDQLGAEVKKIAYELWRELTKGGQRIDAKEFGRKVHLKAADVATKLTRELSPGVETYAEQYISTIVAAVTKNDNAAARVLGQDVASVLLQHRQAPVILDLLGVGSAEADRGQAALAKFLSDRFGWKQATSAGRLQADFVVADPRTLRLINVDWSSSTKLDKFERLMRRLTEDLREGFDGDFSKLAEAYAKASKREVPAAVQADLDALTGHALRETVVRRAIFEVALDSGGAGEWYVQSQELLYDGLAKLYAQYFKS